MKRNSLITLWASAAVCAFVSSGCKARPPAASQPAGERGAPPPTNRVDVPDAVRRNLGITFAKVELRAVSRTIRAPGRFELLPQARREYRTMLAGRVDLHVTQYERVEPGAPLYSLDSPAWRDLQQRLNETDAAIRQARARSDSIDPLLAAHERHHDELEVSVAIWTERVQQLQPPQGAGAVTADEIARARAALASTRADLAEVLEKEAELISRRLEVQAELRGAEERFELLLMNASSLLGLTSDELLMIDAYSPQQHPRWREIHQVEVRAAAPGVVESIVLTNGAWAGETSLVLATVRPELLRFRARGLQSDLDRLRDGLPGRIVRPQGGGEGLTGQMEGAISLGVHADPNERTIDVLLTPSRLSDWARPGVTAQLEIVTEGDGTAELAIPVSATIRDGLRTIFFRRDPRNPDQVIRTDADLGPTDGRWAVIRSGVKEGDEVVLDGVYQLMLATSGSAPKGGHFHADGTFHEGED